MLKLLLTLAPIYFKAKTDRSADTTAGRFAVKAMLFLALIFFGIALFIWSKNQFGAEIGFLALAILAFTSAVALQLLGEARKKRHQRAQDIKDKAKAKPLAGDNDDVANLLPQSIKDDPRFQKILDQVADNPLASISAAVTLGYMVSHEFLDETQS